MFLREFEPLKSESCKLNAKQPYLACLLFLVWNHCFFIHSMCSCLQGSLPIYSSKLSVSVVDNLLLVHQIDAKVVIIYDLFVDSRAPVSAPLPLLWRGYQGSDSSSQATNKENESPGSSTINENVVMYEDSWTFLVPDLILDQTNKVLWRVHLDLEASWLLLVYLHAN